MDQPAREQWSPNMSGLSSSLRAERVREQVVALLPVAAPNYQEALDAGKFYCVIEKHDEPFNFDLPNAGSFLWLCAKSELPIRKVFAHYRNRCPQGDDDFVLTIAGDDSYAVEPSFELKFKDLPAPSRGILLLTAKRKVALSTNARYDSAVEATATGQGRPVAVVGAINSKSPAARLPQKSPRSSQRGRPRKSEMHQTPSRSPISTSRSSMVKQSQSAVTSELSSLKVRDLDRTTVNHLTEEPHYQPRMLDNPFVNDEPELEQNHSARGGPLAQLISEDTPERLEVAVQAGLKVLATLETPLKDMPANADTNAWLEQISKVKEAAIKTRTVVGVVGNTGAGKSSVINAMLDEERLVPTNCMRACTAVVTELSYNHSENPNAKYRAEIEFINSEDWRKELTVCLREMINENGEMSRDVHSAESEAGIAYAKVRAVYHKLTKEDLTRTSVEKLMNNKKVRSLLGSSKKFSTSEPRPFYERLQQFVDSKEKGTEKLDKNGNVASNQPRVFESWPLIKVVKIYTKSPALSTGAVIVDLPGVHDSNAARSAVAQGYMKQCTGLWIVAPINRAVDDKAAKTLLGDTFKRQLKFDGTYSAVSFICSKTDDISLTEATDSLRLGERMADLDHESAEIDSRHLQLNKELKNVKSSIKDFEQSMKHIEDDQDIWEDLEHNCSQGRTVFAPSEKRSTRKRKSSSSTSPEPTRKRRRTIDSDDDQDGDDDDDKGDAFDRDDIESRAGSHEDVARIALTSDEIDVKLDELKRMYKDARREKKTLEGRAVELRKELDTLDDKMAEIDTQKTAIAIDGRNTYSRTAIRQDFAAGVRELDQEAAEDEDPDSFDPMDNFRDYDEVAASLPVFCVSSRAYQKLSGRMKKDSNVPGYSMLAETEIPQLQAHCKKLTEKGRQASCRRFLNSMKQLLGSMALWASDDGTGVKLTASEKDAEKSFLSKRLQELEKALEKVATETMADAAETINDQLFAKFAPAVHAAVQEALPKAQGWGAHKSDGGLYFATYKATTRRSGVFAGAAGARDFNADLAEPIYKTLGGVWEKAFQRRIPNILQSLKKSATNVLKQFHVVVEDRTRKSGHGLARIGMLGANLATHSAALGDICQEAVNKLNDGQRELSRQFTPVIAAAMEPVYEQCNEETGKGQFLRMKNAMHAYVGSKSQYMFQEASNQVQSSLRNLCRGITKFYLDKMDDVFLAMKRDYFSIVGGVVSNITMPKEERMVRRAVDEAITASDAVFREVIDGELEDLKVKFGIPNDETAEKEAEDEEMFTDNDDNTDNGDQKEDEADKTATPDAGPSDAVTADDIGFAVGESSETL